MPMADTWVVVGLDNGGNKNNATVLDADGRFLVSQLFERPSRVTEGPEIAVAALVESFDDILERTSIARARVKAVGLDTPGPASAEGVISSRGLHELLPARLVRLRLPRRARGDARPAGRLQQRRQRRRALRALPALRRRGAAAIVGLGDRRHRARRRGRREGPRGQGRRRHGRRARPRPHPDGGAPRRRPADARRATAASRATSESVASLTGIENNLLPYWLVALPGARAGRRSPIARAAKLVRGYGETRRRDGAANLRAAGDGDRPPVHDRRELHRPRRLLRGRRRGRGRGRSSATGSSPRCGSTPLRGGAGARSPASPSCPTSTWPAPAAPPSPPCAACTAARRKFLAL